MRPLEIILLVVLFLMLFIPRSTHKAGRALGLIPLLVMGLHLLLEKGRWQMQPAYWVAILTAISFFIAKPKSLSKWIKGLGIIGVGLSTFVGFAVPITKLLPEPGFATGTTTFHWVDQSRQEIYAEGVREGMGQIWYPAEPDDEPLASYIEDPKIGTTTSTGLPAFIMYHTDIVETQSYIDAVVLPSEAPYPLLFFVHGLTGFRGQNTQLVQKMAARGYVVISLDHPYGGGFTKFPDGRAVLYNPDVIEWESTNTLPDAQQLSNQWVDDLTYVLDDLEQQVQDPSHPLYNQIDFQRIGLMGHSTGAAAAYQFCAKDKRCDAVAGLDPWFEAVTDEVLGSAVNQPMMIMRSDLPINENNDVRMAQFWDATVHHDSVYITVNGTYHQDFSDTGHLSPLIKYTGLAGGIEPYRMHMLSSEYIREFFDHALLEKGAPLLYWESSEYPEVYLERRK